MTVRDCVVTAQIRIHACITSYIATYLAYRGVSSHDHNDATYQKSPCWCTGCPLRSEGFNCCVKSFNAMFVC